MGELEYEEEFADKNICKSMTMNKKGKCEYLIDEKMIETFKSTKTGMQIFKNAIKNNQFILQIFPNGNREARTGQFGIYFQPLFVPSKIKQIEMKRTIVVNETRYRYVNQLKKMKHLRDQRVNLLRYHLHIKSMQYGLEKMMI